MPLSSGTALTPSMVNVFPVPVCPYAKMVPETDSRARNQTDTLEYHKIK